MPDPIWLDQTALMRAHGEVIALTGGAAGLRDEGLLLSALGRPLNAHGYEGQDDIAVLGATYAVAISRNHPFFDGNKRAAFIGMMMFLARNGLRLTATPDDATAAMYGVAEGRIDIDALAAWVRANSAAT